MNLNTIVLEDNIYQFDVDTGEVLENIIYDHRPYKHNISAAFKNRPLNRSHYAARDLQELKDICKVNKHEYLHNNINKSLKIFDLVNTGLIKGQHLETFIILSNHIQRRNVYMTSLVELEEVTIKSKKNLTRELTALEDHGLLKVFKPLGQKNKLRVLAFNPFLVWRGCYRIQSILECRILQGSKPWYEVELLDSVDEI